MTNLVNDPGFIGQVPAGAILAMAASVEDLQERAQTVLADRDQIIALADTETRDLTDDEIAKLDGLKAEAEKLGKQINARQAINIPGPGRRSAPEGVELQNSAQHRPNATPVPARPVDRKAGFRSFGDYAQAIGAHYLGRGGDSGASQRLMAAATTYGSEGIGSDGGFAVPPEFQTAIWTKVVDQESLLNRCSQMALSSNNMTFPKDETTPWQTSGGILAYWESEAATVSQTKPSFLQDTIRLAKLMALVPITEELLADAVGIEGWLNMKAPQKMASRINTSIIRGTGVGQPEGILTATGSLVSVAKETSQDAASVWFQNVVKMWGRLYAPLRAGAIWLVNQDIEPALQSMAFDEEASSKVPVYIGPNGVSGSPYATLLGRPVVPVEPCSAAGTQGDIILVNLSEYVVYTKAGENTPRSDVSMHLYFDQGMMAYRFTFRMNGKPQWSSTIARENGSNTLSYAVTLDARA